MPPARIRRTGSAINSIVQEKVGGPRAGGASATAARRITAGPALGSSSASPAKRSCTWAGGRPASRSWASRHSGQSLRPPASGLAGDAGDAPEGVEAIGGVNRFSYQLVEEFLRAFSSSLLATLHVEIRRGRDAHHMAEAIFKGLARALDAATKHDPRVTGIPSTKDVL